MCAKNIGHTDKATGETERARPVSRRDRRKGKPMIRLRAFWGVYDESLQRVAAFGYQDRQKADDKVKELTQSRGVSHYVRLDKEPIK
jgi:hypothetical protein